MNSGSTIAIDRSPFRMIAMVAAPPAAMADANAATDDTAKGILTAKSSPLDGSGRDTVDTYHYDPLTGEPTRAGK